MEMRAANQGQYSTERTLKDLAPNVAALLCYVGGWISGIVFLVLEQKNHYIRFHALQSIIVFGTLTVAGVVLGSIPVAGFGFHWAITIIGFIFWIVLMVKAYNGDYYKMPWAGNFAERLATESLGQAVQQSASGEKEVGFQQLNQPQAPAASAGGREEFRARYYSMRAKAVRITGSAFAIAWSAASPDLLKFL